MIFGAVIDDHLGGAVRVTVIATGFGDVRPRREKREQERESEPVSEGASRGFDVPQDILEVPSFLRDD